jgi:hypothetical protein
MVNICTTNFNARIICSLFTWCIQVFVCCTILSVINHHLSVEHSLTTVTMNAHCVLCELRTLYTILCYSYRTFSYIQYINQQNELTLTNDQLDTPKYIYYNLLHVYVSRNILLIPRMSNCINTASSIVTVSKLRSGAQVERQRQSLLNRCTGRSLTEGDDTRCCINPYSANVENRVSS